MSTEGETTGELDTASLGALLQQDVERALGSEPPTVTLERERLLGLLEQSSVEKTTAHTVPRERLQQPAKLYVVPAPPPDVNLKPSLSPLFVVGVIAMLIGLFFAVMQAS